MTANILSEKQEVELPLPQWKENYVFSFIKLKLTKNSGKFTHSTRNMDYTAQDSQILAVTAAVEAQVNGKCLLH